MDFQKIMDSSKKLTLLYVEDDKHARNATQLFLDELFKEVFVAEDGQEGLDLFHKNRIDLVITDINMPRMDGLSMIEKIRQTDRDTSILVLSAHSESDYITDSIKLGAEGYLLKPINIDQFEFVLLKTLKTIQLKKENKAL